MVAPVQEISFVLNNEQVTITGADPNVSLNEWIRSQPRLSGTKRMCGEGGCGCCVVTGVWKDPASGDQIIAALNSVRRHLLVRSFYCTRSIHALARDTIHDFSLQHLVS